MTHAMLSRTLGLRAATYLTPVDESMGRKLPFSLFLSTRLIPRRSIMTSNAAQSHKGDLGHASASLD